MWLSATKCSRSSFVWTGSWHPWPSCMMIWQWNVIRQLFYHWSRGSHSRTSWLRWKKDWGMTRRMIAKSLHQGWANHWLELQRMMAIMHCWLCTEKQRVSNHPRWITVPWFSHRTLQCDWDIFVFKETWRHDCVSTFFLPTMDRIFRSGGNTNRMAGAILQNNETYFECFLSCLGLFLAFMSVVCLLKLMSSGPTCFFFGHVRYQPLGVTMPQLKECTNCWFWWWKEGLGQPSGRIIVESDCIDLTWPCINWIVTWKIQRKFNVFSNIGTHTWMEMGKPLHTNPGSKT